MIFRGCDAFFQGADAPGVLQGANRVTGAKPAAEVLAEHPSAETGGRAMPVVAVQRYGAGRVMAMTGDTTWKWRFRIATNERDTVYYRFWRQSVRWLGATERDEDKARGDEQVTGWTARFGYRAGGDVELLARVLDEDGKPLGGARVEATVQFPVEVKGATSVKVVLTPRAAPGEYGAVWQPPIGVAGLYAASVEARRAGREIGVGRFEFAVGLALTAWTTRPQYEFGRPVVIQAQVRDEANEPLSGVRVEAEAQLPVKIARSGAHGNEIVEETRKLTFTELPDTPGQYQVTWQPPAPGVYHIAVQAAASDGEAGGRYELQFVVGRSDPEFDRLDPDEASLRALAGETNGRFCSVATAASLPDFLEQRRRRELRHREITLWNAPWFFAVLMAVLTTEWLLRKRRGLP
jgi:hypothetical protein